MIARRILGASVITIFFIENENGFEGLKEKKVFLFLFFYTNYITKD
jgi:hypothetical protein